MRPRILVRRPSPRLADGEITHLARVPVHPELALRQWAGYVAVFAEHAWTVTEIAPADEHPDGVFVEDTAVVFPDPGGGDVVVLARPGAASRRGEVASTAHALDALKDICAGAGIDWPALHAKMKSTGRLHFETY